MNSKELTALLRKELDEMEFCDKFKELWRDDFTREELVGLYKRGIEYCIDKEWPDNDFIKKNFDRDMLRSKGVFVDDDFGSIYGKSGVYIFNGVSNGEVTLDDFSTATLYVRNDSDIMINAKGLCHLFIELWDNATANIKQYGNASVYVYVRSKNVKLHCDGDVKIRK